MLACLLMFTMLQTISLIEMVDDAEAEAERPEQQKTTTQATLLLTFGTAISDSFYINKNCVKTLSEAKINIPSARRTVECWRVLGREQS